MVDIAPLQNPSPAASAQDTASSGSAAQSGALSADFDTFLRLLTSQLRNQDPLNPVDSTDFIAQLASFSAVEQQTLTNELLREMIGVTSTGRGLEGAAGWIGLEVSAPGPGLKQGGASVTFEYPAKAAAQSAVMVVRDSAGTAVATRSVNPLGGAFVWDGQATDGATAPDGLYTAEVAFFADDVVLETVIASSFSTVKEVRLENGTTILHLENGTRLTASDAKAVRSPEGPAGVI